MRALVLWLALLLPSTALADRTIIVNFSTATLSVEHFGETMMETRVVLPRGDYYPIPVSGTVTRAVMGPTWTPTANMHRDYPGRYRQSYGPYEPGNAMGHCKVYIDFDVSHHILPFVRIHGNARNEDLGQRVSRSCIRIPDSLCSLLIEHANTGDRVHFVR